jgi:hypothetical protein
MSPQATLAYLAMLWQVAMYCGMTLKKYTVYRDESLRGITTIHNQNEQHMDDVFSFAQRALYDDMSQFVKLYTHAAPSTTETADETNGSSGPSTESEGDKYEALRLKYTPSRGGANAEGASASATVPALGTRNTIGVGSAPARRGRRRPLRGRARSPRSARGLACGPSQPHRLRRRVATRRARSPRPYLHKTRVQEGGREYM